MSKVIANVNEVFVCTFKVKVRRIPVNAKGTVISNKTAVFGECRQLEQSLQLLYFGQFVSKVKNNYSDVTL